MFDNLAYEEFNRALRRSFWRKIGSWLTGKSNELLPYEEVRRQLPLQGQRDIGLQTVPLDLIVGSVGRYRDFDRAFLPTQRNTTERWVNISKARHQDIELPPIEVYKLGEVYFVKDGNHRVSVARERGQTYIDAFVTEIDVPITVTPDMALDDLLAKKEYALFLQQTGLNKLRPEADLELTLAQEYARLLKHIETHRWFISREQNREVPYTESVASWYDNVYAPLVQVIQEHQLDQAFPGRTLTDLYLLVSEYQWLLRESYQGKDSLEKVMQQMSDVYSEKMVRNTIRTLRRESWIEQMILEKDRQKFLETTQIETLRPGAQIVLSLPGKYQNLLRHISAHQYYMGQERQSEVPYEEAVVSFYDNVYLPLLKLILEQDVIADFPGRTEADLVLWVLDHRQDIVEALETLPRPQDE